MSRVRLTVEPLALLGCGDIYVSKLRKETLRAGEVAPTELRGVVAAAASETNPDKHGS